MNPSKAKGYIEMNGPYWRLERSASGRFSEVARYMGAEGEVGDADREESLEHFTQICALYEGGNARLNLYCRTNPRSKSELGPFPFYMDRAEGEAVEVSAAPAMSGLGARTIPEYDPMEVIHLQRETLLSGMTEQRNLLHAEQQLHSQYREKFDKLAEDKQDLKMQKALLERDRKDFEEYKRKEEERLRQAEDKFTDRAEIVRAGASNALESLLAAWTKSDTGLAGIEQASEEPAPPPTPQYQLVESLAQYLYQELGEMPISYLQAINKVIRKHVQHLKAKFSQTQQQSPADHADGAGQNHTEPAGSHSS